MMYWWKSSHRSSEYAACFILNFQISWFSHNMKTYSLILIFALCPVINPTPHESIIELENRIKPLQKTRIYSTMASRASDLQTLMKEKALVDRRNYSSENFIIFLLAGIWIMREIFGGFMKMKKYGTFEALLAKRILNKFLKKRVSTRIIVNNILKKWHRSTRLAFPIRK